MADAGPDGGRSAGTEAAVPQVWWTRRAVAMHVTLVVLLPAFGGLFWWQVERVRQGNTLSWAYVFEWPFFAGYAVYLWWKLVHDQAEASPPAAGTRAGGGRGDVVDDAGRAAAAAGDEALAAYNRYLAELHASGRPKRW